MIQVVILSAEAQASMLSFNAACDVYKVQCLQDKISVRREVKHIAVITKNFASFALIAEKPLYVAYKVLTINNFTSIPLTITFTFTIRNNELIWTDFIGEV